MAKKRLPLAIFIFSMMLFPSTANAFWWDIIKGAASGIIKIVSQTAATAATVAANANNPAPSPAPGSAPVPVPKEVTEGELLAAFDELRAKCSELKTFPCAVGTGKSLLSPGDAAKRANIAADGELATAMGQFVEFEAEMINDFAEAEGLDIEGSMSESKEYSDALKVAAKQQLVGAQTYYTKTFVTEKSGKKVYEVWAVRVLDKNLFAQAMDDASQDKPISEQIVKTVAKSFASKVAESFKKRKK